MSDAKFPLFAGLEWGVSKAPQFNTRVMQSVNGRELRASYTAVPKFEIQLSYEFLRQGEGKSELEQIEGFFIARRGSFDSFLLALPGDSKITWSVVGDGVADEWQITKYGLPLLHVEPVGAVVEQLMYAVDDSQNMWSSEPSDLMWFQGATVTAAGKIILAAPLALGQVLQFTGTYYYRCRFAEDMQEYSNFLRHLWQAKQIMMIGSLGDKV